MDKTNEQFSYNALPMENQHKINNIALSGFLCFIILLLIKKLGIILYLYINKKYKKHKNQLFKKGDIFTLYKKANFIKNYTKFFDSFCFTFLSKKKSQKTNIFSSENV